MKREEIFCDLCGEKKEGRYVWRTIDLTCHTTVHLCPRCAHSLAVIVSARRARGIPKIVEEEV